MQTVYASSRRIIASFLIVALLVFVALRFIQGLDVAAFVVAGAAVLSVILLAAVIGTSRPRLGLDTLAFLLSGIAVAVASGASAVGFLVYLPPLVVAIAFATAALVLRTEAGAVVTKDRL